MKSRITIIAAIDAAGKLFTERFKSRFSKGPKCPYRVSCSGFIVELQDTEHWSPEGFRAHREYFCSVCQANFIGTSEEAISALRPTERDFSSWRVRVASDVVLSKRLPKVAKQLTAAEQERVKGFKNGSLTFDSVVAINGNHEWEN